jgi:hypothetical protein
MKKLFTIVALFAAVAFSALSAQASECPLLVKQLNEAKVSDPAKAAEVKKMAAEAQKLHEAGKHAESVAKAEEAAKVGGITLQHKQK